MPLAHDPRNLGRGVDLGPVARLERVKGPVANLRPQVFGGRDVKVRIVLAPNEQERHVRAAQLDQARGIGVDLIGS